MFVDTNSPAEICSTVSKRGARHNAKPIYRTPSAPVTDDGRGSVATQTVPAVVGSPNTTANTLAQPNRVAPWASGHIPLAPYDPAPNAETVAEIVQLHRLRQDMIRAQTKLSLQGQAALRFMFQRDEDFASDEAKEKARKRNESLYRQVAADPTHELYGFVAPYLLAAEPLEAQRAVYEKALVKAVKRLPVYEWVKGVKGFGDISFATIVGECGDIGTYKSVSAVWKRLGLAVYRGKSGRSWRLPHERGNSPAPTAAEWIDMGYVATRRSVSWNARKGIIGSNGLWRPDFGEDVQANSGLTYYQRIYSERARSESIKLGLPVKEKVNAKGVIKESYTQHVAMRAHRYVEKRLIKHLYIEWRRAA